MIEATSRMAEANITGRDASKTTFCSAHTFGLISIVIVTVLSARLDRKGWQWGKAILRSSRVVLSGTLSGWKLSVLGTVSQQSITSSSWACLGREQPAKPPPPGFRGCEGGSGPWKSVNHHSKRGTSPPATF